MLFVTEAPTGLRLTELTPECRSYAGETRTEEMLAASDLLGFRPVRLGFPLRQLDPVPTGELIAELERHLEGVDVLAGPGPMR